jgi:hypothetical protein
MELVTLYLHQTPALIEMVLKEAFSLFPYDTVLLTLFPVVLGRRWGNISKELLECVILCYCFENKYGLVISTHLPHFTALPWC